MKTKRTLTIEFDRVKITTSRNLKRVVWCELCRQETEFLNKTEANDLVNVLAAQGMEIKEVHFHFYHPTNAEILICLKSIMNPGGDENY
ncbi:MAG: hypothetical protein H7070_05865 [Saprospiraceae bacterium]|nr:hypothetical protein [Pyrinomonadaceae bacterium]